MGADANGRANPQSQPSLIVGKRANHLVDDRVGLLPHLIVGGVLNGMGHEHPSRTVHAKRLGLSFRRILELDGSDGHRRLTLNLEPYRVMQTARGTGSSVSQPFDDEVVFLADLLAQLVRRRLGEGRLGVAVHRNPR